MARGYQQPLAAAYRVSLAQLAERLVKEDRLRPAFLFAECQVERLDDATLLADPALAKLDADLDSVLNVNTPDDYQAARRRPAAVSQLLAFGAALDGALSDQRETRGGRHQRRSDTERHGPHRYDRGCSRAH